MAENTKERLHYLLQQYAAGSATDTEVRELAEFIKQDRYEQDVKAALERLSYEAHPSGAFSTTDIEAMIQNILNTAPQHARVIRPGRRRLFTRVAAAVVIMVLLAAGYFIFRPHAEDQLAQTQEQRFKNDVAPGYNGATLTLGDGSTIALDSTVNNKTIQQGTVVITNRDNQLTYTLQQEETAVAYNTLATARGQTYTTVLADGSRVWLNAASSVTFPVAFTGSDREVKITGEAYFEVTHNAGKPFRVKVNGVEVQVLGTHFNVNAYSDEGTVKTTLLEGSVKVSLPAPEGKSPDRYREGVRPTVTLKPGQQAEIHDPTAIGSSSDSNRIIIHNSVDLAQVMAWKEGRFLFTNADIKTIMQQLARWYDVEVSYQGDVTRHFVANIGRDVPVSKVLRLLELTGRVHFMIDGKKITVMP